MTGEMTGTEASQFLKSKAAMKNELPSLVEMARKDPELLEFFKLIHEQDLREKAVELLSKRMEN